MILNILKFGILVNNLIMNKKEWEDQFVHFKDHIIRDEQKAKENTKIPQQQCCFGILGVRCKNKAVKASTFYGHTTGLSWCKFHGNKDRTDDYPHGMIII